MRNEPFDYHGAKTTEAQRLAYLDGWGLATADIKPTSLEPAMVGTGEFRADVFTLQAFQAGKVDAEAMIRERPN